MFGAIYGDIAGSAYEFRNIRTKDFTLFERPCRFTDDTVMTLAVAKALTDTDRAEGTEGFRERLIDAMHAFGRTYPYAGYGGYFHRWLKSESRTPYHSFGNGSAMRVSPVAWFAETLEEALLYAQASAEVTHDHPEGIKGAIVTAGAVFLARRGASKEEIADFIVPYYTLDFTLDEIRPHYIFDATCQGSVPQAMQAFLEAESFEDTIKNAISIGGDSDTIAAIAGAVAEAYYGMTEEEKDKARSYLTDHLREVISDFEKKYGAIRR